MKIDQLLEKIKENKLKLPRTGTGRNGKIIKKDLENTLGDYFAKMEYRSQADLKHLSLRRSYPPMKAYRFNQLSVEMQDEVFIDNNNWILEPKLNGWRMVITFVPDSGFRFWGGNISEVDFLPVDYTDNILIDGYHPQDDRFIDAIGGSIIIDTECICNDTVEMQYGEYSTSTLDAVKAILGSWPERSVELQAKATLEFHMFDVISDFKLKVRETFTASLYAELKPLFKDQLHLVPKYTKNKKEELRKIWINGGEGCVLKNLEANIVSGSRRKDIAIKVKRTMAGQVGDDIDAFVIGYINTPEWSKKGLIGGLQLGVHLPDGRIHHIATVSSMPDTWRNMLTRKDTNTPTLKENYVNRVLVVDGQELSSRNKLIMHAVVDFERGFRTTKAPEDCVIDIEALNNEKF